MQLRVLGHLEASVDDRPVALGGVKQRAILAMLGLEANRPVSAERLIEGLWGQQPPASAAKMVQNYVWRLRTALADDGGAEIVTRGRAYELRIDAELVDVCRLERLVDEAARAGEAGNPGDAARAALALFRGEPLADVADEPFAIEEVRRLEELRLRAAELAIEADLAAGRHDEVVGEVEALVAENPLRERFHAQRMLALYRCGRQAEALEAYRQARHTLVEEIGVEPAPDLRRLHDAILRQDPALEVEPATAELQRELDASALPPMIGRDEELERLRERWRRAASGYGGLFALVGAYGMGKTRVAAELAGEVHREGATVLYAGGSAAPEAALATLARARAMRRPALVVLDDADRSPAEVRSALRELALDRLPVLVLATGQEAAALRRLGPRETLVLEPLDAAGVGAIAGLYAPDAPAEALLAASDGVPRRVHEAAGEWARREATRRVDAAADRAAAGRSAARASEAELAGTVIELQSARERAGLAGTAAGPARTVCPYKGLATFGAEDAEYFFGRERLVAELVAALVGAPLLAVVGPSGCGKSSVVRAGLLPALAGGVLPGSDGWTQAVIRPGEHPLTELGHATRRLARERRGVLTVDQFEELFTACQDEGERTAFVAEVVRVARGGDCAVVLTVRADFYGRCAAYPELSRLLGANHVLVGPMSRDELRRAIERPAQRVGLGVEPELVDALLADVEDQPGALPLLSTALLELWRGRDGSRLRLAAYARSGGVQGAVARLAEEAFVELEPPQQASARTLLLRLADEREGGTIVRRRIALADLAAADDVVGRLADRRLLTVSDGTVEVAHEALLREWPRLRGWLDEDVEGRRLHRRLGDAARAWAADARDPGGLYRGARLASALDWASDHDPELNRTERAFLDDSRRASGRAQRRLRLVLAGVASLLVLAVIAGAVALDQRGAARAEATVAAAQRVGAQALAEDDLDRALLLARQGVALDDSPQTRGNLLATLLRSPAAIGVTRGDSDRLMSLDLSPDGRTLAVLDSEGRVTFVDARTRRSSATSLTVPGVNSIGSPWFDAIRFSDDGSRLAVGGEQPVVLDAVTHRVVARLRTSAFVYALRFSAGGRTLLAVFGSPPQVSTYVQRFDARSGAPLGEPWRVSRGQALAAPILKHDGGHVVTSADGGPTSIGEVGTRNGERRLPYGADRLALSPDERLLLLGGRDGSVRFVDLAGGDVRTASGRHAGAIVRAAFSPDGRTAVTAGEDRRLIVWDVRRAAARDTLEGHAGQITGLAIDHDARTLYSAAMDGRVIAWDLAGERRFGRPFTTGPYRAGLADGPAPTYALRSDGRILAVGHPDGRVTLVDARTLRERSTFPAVPVGAVVGLAYVPRQDRLLVVGEDGFLGAVDPSRGNAVTRVPTREQVGRAPTFSADGRLMATVSIDEGIAIWTLDAGRPVGRPRLYYPPGGVEDASLSPDGRTLAVLGLGMELVDVATFRRLGSMPGSERVRFSVRFTPDGRDVVSGSPEGWARLWSAESRRPATRELGGHTGMAFWHAVSPDGRTLATGSLDGMIRLFDLGTQRPLGAPLPGLPNRALAPVFTPDGAYLLGITDAGRAYRWDVRPSAWARHACAVAGRTLTRAEWDEALPEREYAPACGA